MHLVKIGGGAPNPLAGPVPRYIGVLQSYIHGWDPGDPGQPTNLGAPIEDPAGTCTLWGIGEPLGVTNWPNGAAHVTTDITGLNVTRYDGGYYGPSM